MKDKLGDNARLYHIRDSIIEIGRYIENIDREDFFSNTLIQSACIRQLEIIGEASSHLTRELLDKYNEIIRWPEIIGLRNLLIHEYFGVDLEIIWQIIKTDLPDFAENIERIINQLE